MPNKKTLFFVLTAILCLAVFPVQAAANNQAPRITKDKLCSMLGAPDLVVIDVRTRRQWEQSETKIPGAVHEPPFESKQWGSKYDPDATVVTY
jgi:rhodanese-related sulfurtransferase